MKKLFSILGIVTGSFLALAVLVSAIGVFPGLIYSARSTGYGYVITYGLVYFIVFGLCLRWALRSWKVISAENRKAQEDEQKNKMLDSDLDS